MVEGTTEWCTGDKYVPEDEQRGERGKRERDSR